MNECLWFHAMEIGHALGTLKTPAHGMGSSIIGKGFGTMQHCGQENTVTTTTLDNKPAKEPSRKLGLGFMKTYGSVSPMHAILHSYNRAEFSTLDTANVTHSYTPTNKCVHASPQLGKLTVLQGDFMSRAPVWAYHFIDSMTSVEERYL